MPNGLDRLVTISVSDRYGRPLAGANVTFTVNGRPAGSAHTGPGGNAHLQVPDGRHTIEVKVEYGTLKEHARLADSTNHLPFRLKTGAPPMTQYVPAIVGLLVGGVGVALAFVYHNPTLLQARIILALLALGGGGVASTIPGLLRIDINLFGKVVVGAAGALAVVVLLFFFNPLDTIDPNALLFGGGEEP